MVLAGRKFIRFKKTGKLVNFNHTTGLREPTQRYKPVFSGTGVGYLDRKTKKIAKPDFV